MARPRVVRGRVERAGWCAVVGRDYGVRVVGDHQRRAHCEYHCPSPNGADLNEV